MYEWRVCMYTCIYVYDNSVVFVTTLNRSWLYIYVYIYIYIFPWKSSVYNKDYGTGIYMYVYICIYVSTFISIYVCMYVYVHSTYANTSHALLWFASLFLREKKRFNVTKQGFRQTIFSMSRFFFKCDVFVFFIFFCLFPQNGKDLDIYIHTCMYYVLWAKAVIE